MTTAQVVETSVTVNNNSPIQDYINPDSHDPPTNQRTPGFKAFTIIGRFRIAFTACGGCEGGKGYFRDS